MNACLDVQVGAIDPFDFAQGRLSIARASRVQRPIQIIAVDRKRPVIIWPNQSCADRILANICHFFIEALVMPQSVIKEISLPINVRDSGRDPFEIADQI